MTELAQRNPQQELVEWVRADERRAQIAMALPEGVSIDRFERATATALLANPDLLKADRQSLYLAILNAAQAGLVPDGRKSAIVVYGTKAQFLPMRSGVQDTLAEFGWATRTGLIYENDTVEIDDAEQRIKHSQPRPGTDRGELQAAYAWLLHRDGQRRVLVVMSKADIDYVRAKAAKNNPAWKSESEGGWYTRMAEKTPLHRAAKKVGLDPKDRQRIDFILDAGALETGGAAELLYGPNGERLSARVVSDFAEQPSGVSVVEVVPVEVDHVEDSPDSADPADDTIAPSGLLDGGSREEVEARSPGSDGKASPDVSTSQPEPAEGTALDEEAEMLALNAADFVPPSGKFSTGEAEGPRTLAEIYALDDEGRKYLTMCLRKLGDGEWRVQTELFCRVSMPEVYQQVMAERALA